MEHIGGLTSSLPTRISFRFYLTLFSRICSSSIGFIKLVITCFVYFETTQFQFSHQVIFPLRISLLISSLDNKSSLSHFRSRVTKLSTKLSVISLPAFLFWHITQSFNSSTAQNWSSYSVDISITRSVYFIRDNN